MVPTMTTILQRFTSEWAMPLQPKAILTVCREIEYTAWRDRVLTPVTTVQLFLLQMLHGNTTRRHLPHSSGLRFSAAAYWQARAKLPLRLFAPPPRCSERRSTPPARRVSGSAGSP
jgi:hypothetical protein